LQLQIVGPPSVEKANFGEQMINLLAKEMTIRMCVLGIAMQILLYLVQVFYHIFFSRTAESLPLPSASTARPRIDFVLFMLSMVQADSYEVFRNSVKQLDEEYFLGKCSVVVTQGKRTLALHIITIN